MKTLKPLFLQLRPIYSILFTILTINISVNLLADVFINKNSSWSIPFSICLYLAILLVIQCIFIITNCFPMSLILGSTRKQSAQDIFLLLLIISAISSVVINLALFASSQKMFGAISYLMGYNWNTLSNIFYKLISLSLVFLTLSGSIMWIVSGLTVEGVFNGLSRVLIALTLVFAKPDLIKEYVVWGRNPFLIHMMLLLAVSLTHYFTYRTLIRYEIK